MVARRGNLELEREQQQRSFREDEASDEPDDLFASCKAHPDDGGADQREGGN